MPIVAGCASPTQGVCRGLVSRGIRFVLIQWVFQLRYSSFRPLLPGGEFPFTAGFRALNISDADLRKPTGCSDQPPVIGPPVS